MKGILLVFICCLLSAFTLNAQTIRVHPTGVNVNSQNPTTVFLTFGQIPANYSPAEAIWCGELIAPAPPAAGLQCRPDTIYGSLPARHNLSQTSGNLGLTDIMSIPPSIVRRAYLAAVEGNSARFFYVRRFVSSTGQPDQFVNVTCRMTGGGARVPFALTEVRFVTGSDEPILFLKNGEKFPDLVAEIKYNGTGRLKGRWEIVQPGEEMPVEKDLLTEATLSIEERANQRRYTQIERFDHFLPPTGKFTLKLENPDRIPLSAEGQYLLLLRVEATDDKEGDSNLATLGVGPGVVHSGAVAGFPLPTLKLFVGGDDDSVWHRTGLLSPTDGFLISAGQTPVFTWQAVRQAEFYKLEISENVDEPLFSAVLPGHMNSYRAPSWFFERYSGKKLRWRIVAIDGQGRTINKTRDRRIDFR